MVLKVVVHAVKGQALVVELVVPQPLEVIFHLMSEAEFALLEFDTSGLHGRILRMRFHLIGVDVPEDLDTAS